ncbi:hypothetical protein [Methylobacterium oryzae]|uniref:Protein of unassigned function n=1 Tax=Methylobacterium oryzae CBMB20 TaxID=693986 RepID=A0A089P011_9HYPH|nr:hypothetical protein [Methylobacterium oryzae]AIQ91363.1 protein of unassigned function [Methylobacterium oryzae CBMB20]
MKRREPPEAEWGEDEEREVIRDKEIADEYGFEVGSVTCARHDLVNYIQYYSDDPFEHHIELRRKIKSAKSNLLDHHKLLENLFEGIPDGPRKTLQIDDILDGIRERADRLDIVREALPMRFDDIKKAAVKLLIAYWVHEPRRKDIARKMNVTASVFDDTPSHPAMRYVKEMFARFNDKILGDVSGSTLYRALHELGDTIPTVKQLAPYDGDVKWLS